MGSAVGVAAIAERLDYRQTPLATMLGQSPPGAARWFDRLGWHWGHTRPLSTRRRRKVEWTDTRFRPVQTTLAATLGPTDTRMYVTNERALQVFDALFIEGEIVHVRALADGVVLVRRAIGNTRAARHEADARVDILGPAFPEVPWDTGETKEAIQHG